MFINALTEVIARCSFFSTQTKSPKIVYRIYNSDNNYDI